MLKSSVGISNLSVYIPRLKIKSETVAEARIKVNPDIESHIKRAIEYTGQKSIRFPSLWEDTSTMAAQASWQLLNETDKKDISSLRYIVTGTETGVDHSKPVSAYVEGMLQKSGLNIPETLSTSQVQHACASGTISMLNVSALVAISPGEKESGLVICSDIARYDKGTTAEITQGAGSVAMLIEKNPDLLELDLTTMGYASKDVDDFFRPLGSKTAKVKGRFSIKCYRESLKSALLDHCLRRDNTLPELLKETDMFVLHVPYKTLPMEAMEKLIQKQLGLSREEANEFLNKRGFQASIEATEKIGNLYTGSMFLALTFLLKERYEKFGSQIIGKKVLLISYGSGNTMSVVSAKIAGNAPQVIKKWNLENIWESAINSSLDQYEEWLDTPSGYEEFNKLNSKKLSDIPENSFFLQEIREDGYHEYSFQK